MNASMPTAVELAATDPDYVDSLERGLSVLKAFSEQEEALSVGEVASLAGITRTAARRFALTLEYLGYASQTAEGYRLAPGVLAIGDAYLRSNPLPDAAHPHLDELVRTVGETASLTVLHKRRVYYAARVAADRIVTANITVGTSVAAHSTATGRVLLGDLAPDDLEDYLSSIEPSPGFDPDYVRERIEEARTNGWAVADQELTPGIRSVAVPLHDPKGRIVAALNIAAHATRVDAAVLKNDFVPLLQSAAQRTAATLWPASGTAPARSAPAPARARAHARTRPSDVIQSVERGLCILTAFDEDHRTMNLAQISEVCQLPRSAARRFVLTLISLGYLEQQGRTYAPTPLVLELGYSLLPRLSLADVARPRLEALARRLGASVSIGVLDGVDVRYVARASAPSPLTVNIRPGTRVPAERTAMGQVLLSLLPPAAIEDASHRAGRDMANSLSDLDVTLAAVREQGWSYVDQLLEAGIRAVAVPLRNRRGEVVAAMSASVHEASTRDQDMANNFLPALRNAANEFVTDLRDGLNI
ncbi:IclR family transcriptional regulator domain-containing protein [Arthrobacter sp. FW306-07-I]|uniref:IclR family transcriptional regulator domain-containing protein n=1 Tax=Arthrobacter sp. FW306-07-I TaxID=2879622 RepID=UPI001F019294|nr:IclR family transcriptional regulator C-terminal domain-containing protein [Arthrobacter sp. FW306-07-I]UKA75250.1 helix-turn-helix domain-containing protein [Arthrobacter sp. FW306-07-I]